MSEQVSVPQDEFGKYSLTGRSSERDRAQIRELLKYHPATIEDCVQLTEWLGEKVLPLEHKREHILESAMDWFRKNLIEPPSSSQLDRIVGSAVNGFEQAFFSASYDALSVSCQTAMDRLLKVDEAESENEATPFAELRLDPGRPSLESVLNELEKLRQIVDIGLSKDLFSSFSSPIIQKYRLRAATEPPREIQRHPKRIRYTLIAITLAAN